MNYLENILSWKTDKLHGYGLFHLIIVLINIFITIIFIRRYKNHNEKQVIDQYLCAFIQIPPAVFLNHIPFKRYIQTGILNQSTSSSDLPL